MSKSEKQRVAEHKAAIDMQVVKLLRWLRDVEGFEKVAHTPESMLYVKDDKIAVAIHTIDHDDAEYEVYVGEVVSPDDERLEDVIEQVKQEADLEDDEKPTKVIAGYESMRYKVTPDLDLIAIVKVDINALLYGLMGEA